MVLTLRYMWVRVTEEAALDPLNVLERRHGLAEIGERGGGVRLGR